MKRPIRHIWEDGSTHRAVDGDEYDLVWDYAEQLEAEVERWRAIGDELEKAREERAIARTRKIYEMLDALKSGESDVAG